jgi:ribonuclease P protein component
MLSKNRRIPREVFSELLTHSKYTNSPTLSLRFVLDKKRPGPQVGVSVSKKVSKSAVVRNTIRRRVYSAVQILYPDLLNGLFLFVAKSGAEKLKGEKLKEEVKKLIERAR